MQELLTINNKTFYNTDTTVLYTSKYNYNKDIIEFTNNNCEAIVKNSINSLSSIPVFLLNQFSCLYLQEKNNLSLEDNIKINILNALLTDKEIVVFFNVLTYVEKDFKEKIINYLHSKNKTIINYTCEIEETLLLDYIMVLHEDKILMEGKKEAILQEEKILKKLGFNLPFIIELSSGLKYYNLIDKIYYDNKSLVDDLWK